MNVVSAVFNNCTLINTVIERASFEYFSHPNDKILKAIHDIKNGSILRYKRVSVLTVWRVLEQSGYEIDKDYITKVASRVVPDQDFFDSLMIVAENGVRSYVAGSLKRIEESVLDDQPLVDIMAGVDLCRRSFSNSLDRLYKTSSVADGLKAVDDWVRSISENRGALTGVSSGYKRIDTMTGGWQFSDFIVIGGRPSMGKTALALGMAKNSIDIYSKVPAYYSYEMDMRSLLLRIICQEAGVQSSRLRQGKIDEPEYNRMKVVIDQYMSKIDDNKIIIDDHIYPLPILLSKMETALMGIADYAIVDYMQLIPVRGRSREEEVSEISRSFKSLAKKTRKPIIALSQLSRRSVRKGVKVSAPALDDLRESGAIEQDADVVMFVHRPYYYGIKEVGGRSMLNIAEIHIAKQRNGPTGMVELIWIPEYSSFANPSVKWAEVK